MPSQKGQKLDFVVKFTIKYELINPSREGWKVEFGV